MTKTNKQKLPALDNSGKVKNPDLATIGENNYTSTVLKYGSLAIKYPQLKTKDKTIVGAINEIQESGGGGSSTLAGLTDVDLQDPAEGQVLSYNSSDSTWENSSIDYSDISNTPNLATVATSGDYADLTNKPTIPGDLTDLGDVNIASPSDDQVLKYDATSGKWVNGAGGGGGGASDLNDLDDVTITSPEENQVLKYDGSQWVNATSSAGATNLNELTDVTITTPAAGQSLVYNSTSKEWENNAVDYSNIANKPTLATVATSGSYTDLSDTPTIPAAQVNSDWNSSSGVSQILNKPNLATVATSGSYDDLTNKPTIPSAQVQSDYGQTDNTKIDYIKNKPNLATVATSGDYTDLINKPTIPAAQVNSDWDASSGVAQILNKPNLATVATSGNYSDLSNKPTIPAAQVNSDWNAVSGIAQILNKPSLAAVATSGSYNDLTNTPTLAAVATSGNYSDLSNTPTIPDGLADLTDDVNISSPTNGQILKYDSTSSKWVNGTGSGGASYTELTQLEYDALSDAQKKNGTMYFITDVNGNGQDFQPVIYSNVEREIGVWTDGRPLYECTFYSTTKYGNSDTALVLNSQIPSNIDVIDVHTELNIEATDGGNVYKFASTSSGWVSSYYDVTHNIVYAKQTLSSVSNVSTCLTSVILRYTKQADPPGSGTWTPQGIPAIHYSTDEKVIGTWLDGSTLYEKTIYYAGGSYGTITIPHEISNLGKCVDAFGTCHDIGYGSQHEGEGDMPLPRIATDGYNVGIAGVNATNIIIAIASIWGNRIQDYYLTLRYTKSSS